MTAPALFDEKSNGAGPKTLRLLQRSLSVYAVLFFSGLLLSWFSSSAALQSFGLGLVIPGGGFLHWANDLTAHGLIHVGLFAAALSIFIASLVLWFATGNAILPPIIWFGSAIAAALMNHELPSAHARFTVPLAALGLIVIALLAVKLAAHFGLRERVVRNVILKANAVSFPSKDLRELSLQDLQLTRSLLDRALQPLEEFSGFEQRDQYQTAALRYQLNFAGYALSMLQANHTPAFQGYLTQAQNNLILKQQDPRIWRYWALENAWGNFERSADPMARDNIMFTGFVGTQIAMFHGASGKQPFDKKSSLVFQPPRGNSFNHDFPGMVQTLAQNLRTSELGLIACEPNWVYPLCNTIGAAALAFHNAAEWQKLKPAFRRSLDVEFLGHNGNMVPCRSLYTGLALPSVGGTVVQALPCFFLNALAPDLAMRHWLVERDRMLKNDKLNLKRFWPVDVGNYRFSRASSFAATAAAAVELGDQEVADLLFVAIDEHCPSVSKSDVRHRPRSSLWAHGAEILARAGRKNGFSDMINRRVVRHEIHIADASYPDVLVASAISGKRWLQAVFYPGVTALVAPLKIAGLFPHRRYAVKQNAALNFTADGDGNTTINLFFAGRTELRIDLME